MHKDAIIRNFSRYAHLYDKYADVQRQAALGLCREIKEHDVDKILEIGCGTGNYTLLLRDKFTKARLKAIDISGKMIEAASLKLKGRGIEFSLGDAEDLDLTEKFDLITSNACFQWFEDLEKALRKYRDLLKTGGAILFSVFGPSTFWELDSSLKNVLENISVSAAGFMSKEQIGGVLKRNFKEIKIKEVIYREYFGRLIELLDKIKYTGIRGEAQKERVSFSRKLLRELEGTYADKFCANRFGRRKIRATYQVFFCAGLKA